VLVVGSAEQYGNVSEAALPVRETQPFDPASPYAVSKVAQEFLARQYARAHGLDVVLTRSFNHSGPGQSPDFVLASFARQIAAAEAGLREPVLNVGNLDVERDFLDVRDVARAYAQLLEHGDSGQAYNVCSGRSYKLRDLVDIYVASSSLEVRVVADPSRMRPADLPVLRGDPSKLQTATGWKPGRKIRQTLSDVLNDWRRRIAAHGATT
jgi:GDP-4-dehydro-6-deoxy-D-mannose reductase